MGSPTSEAGRLPAESQHAVALTSPFLVARTVVTRDVRGRVFGFSGRGSRLPATDVSWADAREFCEKTGLALPTEAQWEFACRAGTTSAYFFGDDPRALVEFAWCFANSGGAVREVGRKPPNAFGLFDVHGNVWEWCADAYADYAAGPLVDPRPASGARRVVRGGCYGSTEAGVRSAFRGRLEPDYSGDDVGFRPVRTVALD